MATLQSISKHVDSFDDVITEEPIKTSEGRTPSPDPSNGKIQTKSLPHGVESNKSKSEKGKGKGKSPNKIVASKTTKKKLVLSKKRSIELLLDDGGQQKVQNSESASSTDLGDYHFKRRVSHFVNMAFENNELETSNLAFADVVRKVINDPIKEDIHPFGRGHLYASAFDGVQPQIRHDDGRYFMWVLATLFIVGIAGSVILMSIAYKPEVVDFDLSQTTSFPRLNTTT